MNELIKRYIELLFSEGNKNKRDIIINLGLLIEKNTDKENPTDYVQLLPSDLLVVNLSEEEKNYILDELIYFLSKGRNYYDSVIWAIGKSYDEKFIEKALETVIHEKLYVYKDVLQQINFVVDIIKSEKIDELLLDINTKNSNFEIIDIEDDVSAAKKGIELVREGKADFIMKGNLPTSTLLREVVNKETGIKKSSVLFHLALLDIPKYNKLLGITDGGMILEPSEEQKIKIIEETSKIFKSLGYEKIKFSLLSAAEMVNPKQKSSVDADEISKHFKNNETLIVEGPLSLDISLDKNIAQEKKYAGNIQGDADVLVVPDIVSGNGISKSLILMAEAKMAGLILGATVPIVLTSRSASDTEKKYSLILALLADKEN